MQVASEQMHLTLLPAARSIYASANARAGRASAQATGLPWIVVACSLLAIAIGFALLRAQRWLSPPDPPNGQLRSARWRRWSWRSTAVWLLTAYAVARADLQRGSSGTAQRQPRLSRRPAITAQRAGATRSST